MHLKTKMADKIIELLKKHPKLRDDCQGLTAMLWLSESKQGQSAFSFLADLSNKKISNPESIRRSWQKVLQERPELRGEGYGVRHKELTVITKSSIKEIEVYLREDQETLF